MAAAEALLPRIRALADQIDAQKELPQELISAMREAGLFRMTVPRAWGGPELDPMTQFEILEMLAAADGSVAWCAYTGASSGYFSCFLDPEVGREMYADIDVITAGAPAMTGKAEQVDGGYKIKGRWSFGSGVANAKWVLGGCIHTKDGAPVLNAHGKPTAFIAFLPGEDVTVIDNWNTIGMRGTGSHDYEVVDLFVPTERTFNLMTSPIRQAGALYQLRTMIFFNHAALALGVARGAMEAFKTYAVGKDTRSGPLVQQHFALSAVATAEALIGSARAYALTIMTEVFEVLERGEELTLRQRALYRLAIVHAHRAAVEAVELLFQSAGSTATRMPNRLERAFRDVHVANQHNVASGRVYEVAGTMLLDCAPTDPMY